MYKLLPLFIFIISFHAVYAQTGFHHDLQFSSLAKTWDEGLPLGNGMVGNLIWQKNGKLRFSLDRADLWDQRPTQDLDKLTFNMVQDQVAKNDYKVVQNLGDLPYERDPAPSKIPGAALEFDIAALGEIVSVRLFIKEGTAEVKWKNGARLTTFIHPDRPIGWYKFENAIIHPRLLPPDYEGGNSSTGNSVEGQGLPRLGYKQGTLSTTSNSVNYIQSGWDNFKYQVNVTWKEHKNGTEGVWSITSNAPYNVTNTLAADENHQALLRGFQKDLEDNNHWWKNFWDQSSLSVPDKRIEKQWYLENYKFGCVARHDAPPITLQAIWTADNGNLPPWKGDIHNDLNTQLSYWPSYTGNHMHLASGFTTWLWKNKPVFEKYTRRYFGVEGLNVPGVTTLEGKEMGGWIQYSCSPTVAGWLAHHFYLEWRYSMDRNFLQEKAYPWIRDVAIFFENISVVDAKGKRKLPLSSSPEINDNTINAWFTETTNYDLAIIRWTYLKAIELAKELHLAKDAEHWTIQLNQWPELSLDAKSSLEVAPGIPFVESHRHLSHLMAFHPLALLDYDDASDRKIIDASMAVLEENGSSMWVGYSFSWQANMYARMGEGQKAAETLQKFASCFVLPNSFHVNGDQCEGKLSSFRYRPFTLEGNFAFASAVQEMLLQSHHGVIEVFPAIPDAWQDASFHQLRAEGAFVISAIKENGKVKTISVVSEKGGELKLRNAFKNFRIDNASFQISGNLIIIQTKPGKSLTIYSTEK
jgi:alpha-L-fucosidase 2